MHKDKYGLLFVYLFILGFWAWDFSSNVKLDVCSFTFFFPSEKKSHNQPNLSKISSIKSLLCCGVFEG